MCKKKKKKRKTYRHSDLRRQKLSEWWDFPFRQLGINVGMAIASLNQQLWGAGHMHTDRYKHTHAQTSQDWKRLQIVTFKIHFSSHMLCEIQREKKQKERFPSAQTSDPPHHTAHLHTFHHTIRAISYVQSNNSRGDSENVWRTGTGAN